MISNNYNYILNGISHEVHLHNHIKIKSDPLPEKELLANKFFIKILCDLFDYLSIEYIIIKNTLLGQKIFKGLNIFDEQLEFIIFKNNSKKISKEEEYLRYNNIFIKNYDSYLEIMITEPFNVKAYIYLYELQNNHISFEDYEMKTYKSHFYDIFPIKKDIFEEFQISVPNKIDIVLSQHDINLQSIQFISYKKKTIHLLSSHPEIFILTLYFLQLLYL